MNVYQTDTGVVYISSSYHLNKLLLLGSGLSANLGMGLWEDLLRKVAKRLRVDYEDIKKSASVNRSSSDGSYDVADALVDKCGRDRVQDALIEKLRAKQNKILTDNRKLVGVYARRLSRMRLSGIITTNWDTLATELTKHASFEPLVWPTDNKKVIECLREKRQFLLYLHGNIDNPKVPLVVTREQAKEVAEGVAEYLTRHLVALHKVIAIGYGFPDRYIRDLMRQAASLTGSGGEVLTLARTCDIKKLQELEIPVDPESFLYAFEEFEEFSDRFRRLADSFDSFDSKKKISLLSEILSEIHRPEDLRNFLAPFAIYNAELRGVLHKGFEKKGSKEAARLLDLCTQYLIDVAAGENGKGKDVVVAGLLASLLVTLNQHWHPRRTELDKLSKISSKVLSDGDGKLVGVIDPLAFALGQQAFRRSEHEPSLVKLTEAQSKHLKLLINDWEWRLADTIRMTTYYSDTEQYIGGLLRHMQNAANDRRERLLSANDVTRLLSLIEDHGTPERIHSRLKLLKPYYLDALSKEDHRLKQAIKKEFEKLGIR